MSAREKMYKLTHTTHLWLKLNAIFIATKCSHVLLSPCLLTHTHTHLIWNTIKRNGKKITKEFQFFHCFVLMFYHCVFASLPKICSHNSILSFRFRFFWFFWAYGAKMLSKCQQMCDNSNCDTTEVYLAFSGKLSFVFGHTQNYHHADHFMLRRKIIKYHLIKRGEAKVSLKNWYPLGSVPMFFFSSLLHHLQRRNAERFFNVVLTKAFPFAFSFYHKYTNKNNERSKNGTVMKWINCMLSDLIASICVRQMCMGFYILHDMA